ncbi:MAG: glycosyltransferase [Candidatus Omnitrophica bacterium]|nr:glycosyltransferase [Candidatus Omnitrophota bacterium]MDD5738169.1 glycosyltransferase [Candidatus Omnitrophota bacterium]
MQEYEIKKALIPAAGKGIRAYPKSRYIPKTLLEIEGRPLIENNIAILRDQLGIRDITVIVGHLADKIKSRLGDGSRLGVSIRYVDCADPDEGLAKGILLAEKEFNEPFICMLGDEYYFGSNHSGLAKIPADAGYVCAVKHSTDIKSIRKNYNVEIEGGFVSRIIEKPAEIKQWNLGCGTYLLRPEIFGLIRRTKPSSRSRKVEFMDSLDLAVQEGAKVKPYYLEGIYYNINTIEDVNQCNYDIRSLNFGKSKVSVVIPAHNEEATIATVIGDYKQHVDEVLVVNNGSNDRTSEVSRKAGARVEEVSLKGYGDTIKYGLEKALGDILIVTEADYSFRSKDIGKFLEYIKDADMVIGTRTTRQLVEQGANMSLMLLLGNLVYAKIVEILWWGIDPPRFTDVGCTYRAIWKSSFEKIKDDLRSTGPEFSVEMMIETLKYKLRVLEIPISYYPRLEGVSKHSKNWFGILRTASRMMRLIIRERLIDR